MGLELVREEAPEALEGATGTPPETSGPPRAALLEELFAEARRGALPRSRPLRSWEPQTLDDTHLQMIFLKATGVPQGEIARQFDYTESRVSIILNHPDAWTILDRLASMGGSSTGDLIEQRLRRLSEPAVSAIELALDARTLPVPAILARAKLGFEVLSRNGYGRVVEHKHNHQVTVGGAAARLLAEAMRESREIPEASYVMIPEVVPTESLTDALPAGGEPTQAPPPAAVLPLGTDGTPPVGGSQQAGPLLQHGA